MATKPNFRAEVTLLHYAIEVPDSLLTWIECGGMRPNGFPPDGSASKDVDAMKRRCKQNDARAERIFAELEASKGISHVEYNGHFGLYVYFACQPSDSERVIGGVVQVLRKAHAQMSRSSAYKQWLASKENTDRVHYESA